MSRQRFRRQKRDWQDLGELDPMWAVLSRPEYRFGHGDSQRFFATGEAEVAHILHVASCLGFPGERLRGLDVGCGAGRVTRALAARFDECVGVDISESMLRRARDLNADLPNCSFVESEGEDLGGFASASFDLVNASIMLQHLPDADAIKHYVTEFVRVLAPGGIAIFQVPSEIPFRNRLQPRARAFDLLRATGVSSKVLYERAHLHPIRMRSLPPVEVAHAVEVSGGSLVLAESDVNAGSVRTPRYYVTRAV